MVGWTPSPPGEQHHKVAVELLEVHTVLHTVLHTALHMVLHLLHTVLHTVLLHTAEEEPRTGLHSRYRHIPPFQQNLK